jgi:putative ABC transport system permease protein
VLQIKQICKQYKTGDLVQKALDGVNLNLRDNEFVAILGPSGSGKTTLLNVIGGLDRYDSGDLIINGISTKKYKDRDWDSYRNHTIGFVFQSYNLIPHLSLLANVELALTISGVSGGERHRRAKEALEKVGLGNQIHKKPNQLSGGQMQRVAIARALVNNPDILLADEPTGALDTGTSEQVMELLKEVAKDRLVVMVTHNPELAEAYATRIVRLRDGKIIDDTLPYDVEGEELTPPEHKNMGKAKMSFLTSLTLSFNNLRTKKGRTILTSFAGSIGIIGIALILALSSGVNNYISDIQKDTMTSYPITISSETVNLSDMMGSGMIGRGMVEGTENETNPDNGVYANYSEIESSEAIASNIIENNLTSFKQYLDDPDSEIQRYLGENGVVYTYNVNFDVYSYDSEENLINSNADIEEVTGSDRSSGFGAMTGGMGGMPMMMGGSSASSGAENFSELMVGTEGNTVSQVITDSYEVLYGDWPEKYNEVMLVLDENNSISADALYQLGLITADEYVEIRDQIAAGEDIEKRCWDYEEICGHIFYLISAADRYIENEDGTFSYLEDDTLNTDQLLENSVELKITGVIRPTEDAANASISTPIVYTSKLTDYIIEHTNESAIVLAQEKTPGINVLNGINFEALDDEAKIADTREYISAMGVSDKASMYQMIQYYITQNSENADNPEEIMKTQGTNQMDAGSGMDETVMAEAMDRWLQETPDNEILLSIYDEYINGASYADNMERFGKSSYDAPAAISIYTDSFEDKEAVSDCIENYNKTVDADNQITYTDYVELMTSSLTSIIDMISYVLIAFVAVSLIVSCIMIGIITHISVMERTKEIGILRALGASKRNISQVFNAETFIIGCCAGLLGVGISVLFTIPINAVIRNLLGAVTITVALPLTYAVALIILSVVITIIGGLLPAKNAAKKDPVIALRTE